jgi:hypothetical protein
VRKAVIGAAALAVVSLVLLYGSGVPFIPGRPPATSDPDPVGLPPAGPITGLDTIQVRLFDLDLEENGLSAPVGPQDSTPAADLRAPVELTAPDFLASLEVEFDRNGGEVRPDLDRSTGGTEGALVAVALALIVLNASRDQDRDRRLRAAAPASAA